ncbi:MAG TPA: hypothetical protein VK776_00285 [Bryobacteraceae bacterium]|nr:hypothetical protein [Bryobacteraceae bacterium]
MTTLPYTIIRVCPEHMCKVFAQERLWERTESGEFELYIWKNTPIDPPFEDYKGQQCIINHDMLILDRSYPPEHHRHEVARVHRFITDTGLTGASGLPDPKELTIGDINYRGITKNNPHCELCEGGDMIPPAERFKRSWYKPGATDE